ncbi:espin-like isoform X1 [Diachasmimorpha longicaudata]|uniref:espin-like isoform X1 n=1 Tax=Diachasmimorpha longicaudata TaxID=58733 RepID=UPI0030B8B52B
MARDRLGSDYSESMSDATTCTCTTTSLDKCSLRSCTMFHEPFFLHPPTSRPRDGIYINPMNPFISESPKPKDAESFYLHSPHDLVYTRITRLFCENMDKSRHVERNGIERKDETLTVKVDVHINNGNFKTLSNGNSIKSDIIKDTDHAYEQICIRPEETESVKSIGNKKIHDDVNGSGRLRTSERRFSRSSSGSESSQLSSEIHYSSATSTPPLSRNSSNEHLGKIPKPPELPERNSATPEGEKNSKSSANGPSIVNPPPPPPPPPPPDTDDSSKLNDMSEKMDSKDTKSESESTSSATNKSDVSSEQAHQCLPQAEVVTAVSASCTETEDTKQCQVTHLVNKHMVLPFIPPKFNNAADSNTLLKPSEYLKSICKASGKNTLSKARSVDNLDIQTRTEEEEVVQCPSVNPPPPGPPPPPLPPLLIPKDTSATVSSSSAVTNNHETPETPRTPQPLATISIQDLTSVQLRRTNIKMHATKTFSAPPPRSVSMTNVSEPFFVQKTDLIAELKLAKDIPGIKKFKVEMAKVEKKQEQNLISEISKSFSVSNFVDQIPERDSAGNIIPIWKRQMLARKAADRAKKELEEQIARENEEKRQKAIPPWKRQLLAKKDNYDEKEKKATVAVPPTPVAPAPPPVKIDLVPVQKRDAPAATRPKEVKVEEEKKPVPTRDNDSDDDAPIIPWRAQLRKTNSKLNILD